VILGISCVGEMFSSKNPKHKIFSFVFAVSNDMFLDLEIEAMKEN